MTDFESVAENKDELLFDLLKQEDNAETDSNVAAPAVDQSCCVICQTSTNLAAVFLLCKHLCMCNECYDTFLANQIATQIDQRANNNDDDDYKLECPICRLVHKPSQIMIVFKP